MSSSLLRAKSANSRNGTHWTDAMPGACALVFPGPYSETPRKLAPRAFEVLVAVPSHLLPRVDHE